MNIKEFIEGNFLSVEKVKSSPSKMITLLSSGEIKKMKDKEKLCFLVEMDGKRLEYYPNQTSLKNLAEAWGTEASVWVGKPIKLTTMTANNIEMVIAIPMEQKV